MVAVVSRVPQQNRPVPRHPARTATGSTAGLLARGSMPVTAFPGSRVPVALWYRLAAYSCGGSCGIGTWVPHRIPSSLSCERPSIRRALNGDNPHFVNRCAGSATACCRVPGSRVNLRPPLTPGVGAPCSRSRASQSCAKPPTASACTRARTICSPSTRSSLRWRKPMPR